MQPTAASRLPLGPQAAYGVGQVAGQIFRDIPSLLLLFFMTTVLGIPPALAGIAIFVPKLVWGMTCDVGIGIVSDRWQGRMARRWWLLIGAAGAPAAMILLFHVPVLSQPGRALYVAGVFSLYMAVFATFSVPYLAIAGELSADPLQRTTIMAWRLVFTSVGVLVADSLAPVMIQAQGGGQPAYERVALGLSACCSASLVIAFFGADALGNRVKGRPGALPPFLESGYPVKDKSLEPFVKGRREEATRVYDTERVDPLSSTLSNGVQRLAFGGGPGGKAPWPSFTRLPVAALAERRFSVLLAANTLQLAGGGMAYASMLYFLTYRLHRQDALRQVGLITLIACATIIASQPLWVFLAEGWGKKTTYLVASLSYGATMAGWSLLGRYGIGVSYAFALLLGVSNSGWTLMGFSMVADIAGEGRAGLYSSVWIAADKIGFALGGALLVGLVLSSFGFDASRAMAGLPQTAAAVRGVVLAYGIFPACLSAVAAAVFWRWGIDTSSAPRNPW